MISHGKNEIIPVSAQEDRNQNCSYLLSAHVHFDPEMSLSKVSLVDKSSVLGSLDCNVFIKTGGQLGV